MDCMNVMLAALKFYCILFLNLNYYGTFTYITQYVHSNSHLNLMKGIFRYKLCIIADICNFQFGKFCKCHRNVSAKVLNFSHVWGLLIRTKDYLKYNVCLNWILRKVFSTLNTRLHNLLYKLCTPCLDNSKTIFNSCSHHVCVLANYPGFMFSLLKLMWKSWLSNPNKEENLQKS